MSPRLPCTDPHPRRAIASALALALVAVPLRAHADPVDDYKGDVARASMLFDAGDFAGARKSFEAAYAIHDEPVLLFDIASTYRREGDITSAIDRYRRFLAAAERDDPRRALAEKTIDELEASRHPEIVVPRPPPPAPTPAPLPPTTAPTPQPKPRLERGSDTGASLRWTGIGFVVASVVTGTVAVIAAEDAGNASDSLGRLPRGASWDVDQQATWDDGRRSQRDALLWTAATAALLAGGVTLYLVGDHRHHTALTIAPHDDGAMMSLSYR